MTKTERETDRKLTRAVAINAFGEDVIKEAEGYYTIWLDNSFWNDFSDADKLYYIVNVWLKVGKRLGAYQRIVKALVGEGCLVF